MEQLKLQCVTHNGEIIERVNAQIGCKKNPLICWQCTVDDSEYMKNNRQHIQKLEDFFKNLESQFRDQKNQKQNQKNDAPIEVSQLIEDESLNKEKYRNCIEEQKLNIKQELYQLKDKFNAQFEKLEEYFEEQMQKQVEIFENQYNEFKGKYEQGFGLNPLITAETMEEEIQKKTPQDQNKYILQLKQQLVPQPNFLKEGQFVQIFQKLKSKCDKPVVFRKNDFFDNNMNQIVTKINTELENVKGLIMKALGGPILLSQVQDNNLDVSINQQKSTCIPLQQPSSIQQSQSNPIDIYLSQKIKTNHTKSINCLVCIDDKFVATASKDKTIKIFKIGTYEEITTLEGHLDSVYALGTVFNKKNNKTLLISGGGNFDSSLISWNVEQKEHLHIMKGHQSGITCLEDLKDNHHVASGSYDNNIIIWNYETGYACFVLRGIASISPCLEGQLKILANFQLLCVVNQLRKHGAMISSVKLLQQGSHIASASWDKSIAIWRLVYDDNRKLVNCQYERSIIEDYAILSLGINSNNGHLLYYSGTSKQIKSYNLNSNRKYNQFDGSQYGLNEIQMLEFLNYQGNYLVGISSNDYSLRIWDGETGKQLAHVKDIDNIIMNNFNTTPRMNFYVGQGEVKLLLINSSDFSVSFTEWSIELN